MTTITIERDKVERWLAALETATRFVYQDNRPECEAAAEDLRAALSAPATAPEPICIKCGDVITAHDPELCGCCLSTRDATSPSWQDAPTCAGLWAHDGRIFMVFRPEVWGLGGRCYGPVPEDKQ